MIKRLPKELAKFVKEVKKESGLVDGCNYMLYIKDDYIDNNLIGSSYPIKNFKELKEILTYLKISIEY